MRLERHRDKHPHMLSGGQQQRVALARALAPRPNLLLLDEPFSGLDSRLRSQIRNETRDILNSTGVTTIMVTHDWEEAMLVADRIALMQDGEIRQFATPDEIYAHPIDRLTAEFFGEVNCLDGLVADGWIETPIGRIENRNYETGTPVDVLIRPEALTVAEDGALSLGPARVCGVQFSGGSSLVQLGFEQERAHVQAKLSGHQKMAVGEHIHLHLDTAQMLVFAKNS